MESINVKVIDAETLADDEDKPDVLPTETDNEADQTNTEPTINPSLNAMIVELNQQLVFRRIILLTTCFISKEEPKDLRAALLDEHWINAMQEELV
ncbi:hypothetical protein LIER_13636 [Lithospermum erythrorhizon]|uniref:Uncharacterized protein n=1 Tax=Lithospermum erythrorhizon TaxID=34254 RepID=A0AAV3PXP4_LITER